MVNEDNSEDRLTKNEFCELIQHLSIQEILAIEYLVSHEWKKLFSRKNVAFACNLCVVDTSSFKSLLDHINGKRHKLEMEKVKQLFHPDYTYPKNNGEESVVVRSPKNNECNDKSFLQNQKNPVKKNNVKNINLIEIKPTSLKNQNLINNSLKTSANCKEEKKLIKEQQKCDENVLTEERNKEQQQNSEISVKSKEINEELQNENTKKTTEADVKDESNSYVEIGVNKFTNSEESRKSCQGLAEGDNLEKDKYNGAFDTKTKKIVINPAAAFAGKKSSLNLMEKQNCAELKPKYQMDKIIIPTANKANDEKKNQSYISRSHLSDLPKFSVKSYSSKSDEIDLHGILGVEYVIKILKHKNDSSPRYECGLCELVLDGFAMQRHLENYYHRLKFCEKHFPTAIRHYRQYMQSVPEHELFKVMSPVLEKLAKAIEKHHGRNLPYECYERDFSLNRHEILAKAFSCRHASEQHGPTFTHVIGADEIDGYINGRQNYTPPTASRFTIFDIKPGGSTIKSDFMRHEDVKNIERDLLSRDPNRNRHASRIATDYLTKDTDNFQKSYMSSGVFYDLYPPANIYDQKNRGGGVQEHVDDKTYNLMVDDFLKGTLKGISGSSRLREYRKRSASPSIALKSKKRKSLSPLRDNDIWQAYRHMVDQEMIKLDEKFKQCRKDPEVHPCYNDEWQKFWKRRKDELMLAGLDHRHYNYQPEWVKFIKVRIEELYNEEAENIKVKCRERLCLPMTNSHLLDIKYHVKVATSLNECPKAPISADIRPIVKVNVPQVVSVLRLMTALEDSLGSLGPKIIDLLSKALQAEKSNPTLVNALILTDENCALIETAKEKFKGLVITGLFEGSKERVLQQVINDTEDLLKYAYQNRQLLSSQRSSESTHRTPNCTSLTERAENILPCTDKKELASKLAASLVAQGKTDFDPMQLQQLLAFYTLVEKKKRGSGSKEKKLSETLSDLLKSSSTSAQNTVDRQLVSNFVEAQQRNFPNTRAVNTTSTTSFNSVLQNSGDNYLINSKDPQLPENAYGRNTITGNKFEQNSDYSSNYTNNRIPYPQNSVMNNMYNSDLYQNNNRIAQNWMFNSNMETNSNNDIGRPNHNQSANWRNF